MFNMKGGFGGGGNMQNLMRQAQKMQENMQRQMAEAEEKLAETTFSTTSGGGMVEVTINGNKVVSSIKIKPEVVDENDIEMLEDLVVAAVNEAVSKASELEKSMKDGITGGLF